MTLFDWSKWRQELVSAVSKRASRCENTLLKFHAPNPGEGAKLAVGVMHAEKKSMNEYLVRVFSGAVPFFFSSPREVSLRKKYTPSVYENRWTPPFTHRFHFLYDHPLCGGRWRSLFLRKIIAWCRQTNGNEIKRSSTYFGPSRHYRNRGKTSKTK